MGRALSRPHLAEIVDGAAAAASAAAEARGLWSNPELAYEHEQLFDSGSVEQAVVLSQRFDLGGVRSRRARAGQKYVEVARMQGLVERVAITAEVRRRFSGVQFHQRRHGVLEGWSRRLEGTLAVIARRETAGDASAYDRKRVERELARAQVEVGVEEGAREDAWRRLNVLVGVDDRAPRAGDAPGDWPRVVGDDLPSLRGEAGDASKRPDLRVMELSAAAADLERQAAEREWVPELVVSAGWRSAAEDVRDHGFVAGLALELPVFDDGEARAAGARALQAGTLARRGLELDEGRQQVVAAWGRAERLTQLAQRFRATSVTGAEGLVGTAEVAYAGGELGLLELLDAHRGTTEDALRVLELDRDARDAAITLWVARGGNEP